MKYPHLGNVSLHEIRQKILKDVKSPAEAAVADVTEYTALATDGAGSSADHEDDELSEFMGNRC